MDNFPKKARLLRSFDYKRLAMKGKRLYGPNLVVEYSYKERGFGPRLGITISKKFGKAHERNRFKRLIREAFRVLKAELPFQLEFNVRPKKPPQGLSLKEVEQELRKFFQVPLKEEPVLRT